MAGSDATKRMRIRLRMHWTYIYIYIVPGWIPKTFTVVTTRAYMWTICAWTDRPWTAETYLSGHEDTVRPKNANMHQVVHDLFTLTSQNRGLRSQSRKISFEINNTGSWNTPPPPPTKRPGVLMILYRRSIRICIANFPRQIGPGTRQTSWSIVWTSPHLNRFISTTSCWTLMQAGSVGFIYWWY